MRSTSIHLRSGLNGGFELQARSHYAQNSSVERHRASSIFRSLSLSWGDLSGLRNLLSASLRLNTHALSDAQVRQLTEAKLSSGELHLVPVAEKAPPVLGFSSKSAPVARKRPAPQPRPRPRPAAEPEEHEPKPKPVAREAMWPGDGIAQAEALIRAARSNVPFCEVCERAKARQAPPPKKRPKLTPTRTKKPKAIAETHWMGDGVAQADALLRAARSNVPFCEVC